MEYGVYFLGGCAMKKGIVSEESLRVRSEAAMKRFALNKLRSKYRREFELGQQLIYEEDGGKWFLNGCAYVKGHEELKCYFEVSEPNRFQDDFAVNYYREDILKAIKPSLANIEGMYSCEIIHDLSSATFDPRGDYKKFLYDGKCTVYYVAYAKESSNWEDYIRVIKSWMKVLYKADYNWYFVLRDTKCKTKCYFTLESAQSDKKIPEDWSDDAIYESIYSRIKKEWF